jgi:hypothetical protein
MKKYQLKPKMSNSSKKLEMPHDEYICNILLQKKKSQEIKDITSEIRDCVNETKIKLERLNLNLQTLEGARSERKNSYKTEINKIDISEFATVRSRNRSPGLEEARSQKYLKTSSSRIQLDMDNIKKKLHEIKIPKYNTLRNKSRDLVK